MVNPRELLASYTARALAWKLRNSGVSFGADVLAFGVPLITAAPSATVEIGDRVRMVSANRATPLGVNHQVIVRALAPGARIVIGDETGISGGTINAMGSVTIGRRCLLGANVTIVDTDFHPVHDPLRHVAAAPPFEAQHAVIIGDSVFIGTGSIVLKGVRIGDNSVIGAGSVVTTSCPPNTIMAGNPARIIGEVRAETTPQAV